jgi:hypothetical protein
VVYGNSIDSELEVIAKNGVVRKACLLIFVNLQLLALIPVMVRRGCSSFKRRYACTYTRGSVRHASGFVLTGNSEIEPPAFENHDVLALPNTQKLAS